MRVLLLNYEYPPCGSGAGLGTEALAEGLAMRGHTVDVVAGGDHASTDPRLFWDGETEAEGTLTVHRVASHRRATHDAGVRGATGYLSAALPVIRDLLERERYDLVHFVFSLPTAALLPLLDLQGAPVVVSLRGTDVPGYDAERRGVQRAHQILYPLTRWIWRRADRLVVPSESLGLLAKRTDPGLRYAVVQNGVNLSVFRPRTALRRAPDGVTRCLAVARLVERNRVEDLIEAMALLDRDRFQLEIVGTGPAEAALRERVHRLNLERQVRFTGWLDRAQVARRYRESDLFTLVPRAEAVGTSFVEALASGLPVVGSHVGVIPELIEDERNGLLVTPRHPHDLARAIGDLAADARRCAEIGRRNRAQAEHKHSWDRVTSRYLTIYNGARRREPARHRVAEIPSSSW